MQPSVTSRLQKIEAALDAALSAPPDLPPAVPAVPPPSLPPSLREVYSDFLKRGGKRWRPLLAHLICESRGGGDAALPLLPLVEFCHNASLMHDDIEDNSPERRGKPACHILYGLDTAINAGAFLYFLPAACIDDWNAPEKARLLLYSLWARNMRRLHLGQAMDIEWHSSGYFPCIDEYFTMCRLKTGTLAAFAAQTGLLASNSDEWARRGLQSLLPETNPLAGAAEKLGLGFQILDDVKNLTGHIAGKKQGDDVVEGKKSLPVLFFVNGKAGEAIAPVQRKERAAFVLECFAQAKSEGVTSPAAGRLIRELQTAGTLTAAGIEGRRILTESGRILAESGGAASTAAAESGAAVAGLPARETAFPPEDAAAPAAAEARHILAGFVEMLL